MAAAGATVGFLRDQGGTDDRWLPLLESLPITAPPIAVALGGIAAGSFAPAFPVELVEKDLRYFEGAAAEARSDRPIAHAVRALYGCAIELGHGGDNIHGVARVYSSTRAGARPRRDRHATSPAITSAPPVMKRLASEAR